MIIKRIYGKNVGNFDDVDILLNKGVVIIDGENYVGKSTILDILRFVVEGNCVKSKKILHFRKRGKTGTFKTGAEFEFKGKTWVIERTSDGKTSDATVFVNGDLKAQGTTNTNIYLADNFINGKMLFNSNIQQQKDSGSFINQTPGERYKIAKSIFDVSYLTDKAEDVDVDISDTGKKIVQVNADIQNYKKSLEEIDNSIIPEEEYKTLSSVLETILGNIKKRNDSISEIQGKIGSTKNQIETVEEFNSAVKQYNEDYHAKSEKIVTLQTKVRGLNEKITTTQKESSQYNTKIESAQTVLDQYKTELLKIVNEGVTPEAIEPLKVDLDETNLSIKIISERVEFSKNGKCPECGQELHGEIFDVTKLESELEELRNKQNTLKDDISSKTQIVDEKERLETKIKETEQRIESAISLQDKTEQVVKEFQNSQKSLLDEIKELQAFVRDNKLKRTKNVSTLQETLSGLEDKLSAVTDEINILESEKKDIQRKQTEYDNLTQQKESYEKKVDDSLKVAGELETELKYLKRVKELFAKVIPLKIIMSKLSYIEQESNTFLHNLFDSFTIKYEEKNDKLLILFQDNIHGGESEFSNLSGMESSTCGLSVRIGLSRFNSKFNDTPVHVLALDEPDSAYTEKNSHLLFNTLASLRDEFEQLILITHKQETKDQIQYDQLVTVKRNLTTSYTE